MAFESPAAPIRIVLADDHEAYRLGFSHLIRKKAHNAIQIVAEAADGLELLGQVERLAPQVVLTDVRMPRMDGASATKIIREQFPQIQVLAISYFEKEELVLTMLRAGAIGFLYKNAGREELVEAIQTAAAGKPYYSPSILSVLLKGEESNKSLPSFSQRELELIRMICEQRTTKEMADLLHLSQSAVERLSHQLKEKTGAKNLVGIALYAIEHQLYTLPGACNKLN
jgi:DNA-binding NarL/FixJ family response regulator